MTESIAIASRDPAHDAVLAWCRAKVPGRGLPVMRRTLDNRCAIYDLLHPRVPKPGGYDWEREDKLVAIGNNWADVALELRISPPEPGDET